MPPRSQSLTNAWLAVGWLGVAAVVYLSLTPTPPRLALGPLTDKWEHLTTYALLMAWFCQVRKSFPRRTLVGVGLITLGVALEFAQRASGVRTFEVADMFANSAGVLLGWLAAPPRLPDVLALIARRLGRNGN